MTPWIQRKESSGKGQSILMNSLPSWQTFPARMLYSSFGLVGWGAACISHMYIAPYLCRNAFSVPDAVLQAVHVPTLLQASCLSLMHVACVAVSTAAISIVPCAMLFAGFMLWHSRHSQAGKAGDCTRFVCFNDPAAHKRYSGRRIDMETMYEMYFDGAVDFKVERVDEFGLPLRVDSPCLLRDVLAYRHEFVDYTFGLSTHLRFLLTRWVPDVLSHSRLQDTAQVRDHYDRSKSYDHAHPFTMDKAEDDFFGMFLGKKMVYTSGIVSLNPSQNSQCPEATQYNMSETLENMQENKLAIICRLVQIMCFCTLGTVYDPTCFFIPLAWLQTA